MLSREKLRKISLYLQYIACVIDQELKPKGKARPKAVTCPDCGRVKVKPDVFDAGKPVSGECPKCGERLYF